MTDSLYGILRYEESYNLGDEVQSIAAQQFLPAPSSLTVDRNTGIISKNQNQDQNQLVNVIYNGWFDGQYCKFPPPANIHPLFISFHINEEDHSQDKSFAGMNKNNLLPKFRSIATHVNYLKAHEPIGCRDLHTVNLLRKHSIQAYFSGCLTLTLKNRFSTKTNEILVVDAHESCPSLYAAIVPADIRAKAIPLRQAIRQTAPHQAKMEMAQAFLDRLAQAKLVITCRLHTALPCLAFGTPVIFLHENLQDVRFDGLLPFLKVYTTGDRLDIDLSQHRNPSGDQFRHMVNTLRERVHSWVNQNSAKFGPGPGVRRMQMLPELDSVDLRPGGCSIISVCMNRTEQLASALPSWIAAGPDEVILVDWGSMVPVQALVDHVLSPAQAKKVRVITVCNVDTWILTKSFNLAARLITCPNLLKVDADTLLKPDFFAYHNLDSGAPHFFAGDWTRARNENERHTNGVVYMKRADFFAVAGYNELITTYGYDDCDLYKRLENNHLRRLLLNLDCLSHIEHSNAMRTESQVLAKPLRLDVEIELNRLLSELKVWTCERSSQFSQFALAPQGQDPRSSAHLRLQYVHGPELSERVREQLLVRALENRDKHLRRQVARARVEDQVESKSCEWNKSKSKSKTGNDRDAYPCERSSDLSPAAGKTLYLHTKNGLGNRLRALASAYNVARSAHRRLVVIWVPDFHCQTKFSELFRQNFLFKQDVQFVESTEELLDLDCVQSFKDGFRDDLRKCVVYNYDQCNGRKIAHLAPDDIYIVSACTLNSPFSDWQRDSLVLRHLELVDEIAEQVFLFQLKVLDMGQCLDRAVGVHLRMGQDPAQFRHEDVSFYSAGSKEAITKWRNAAHWTRFAAEMERIAKADPSVVFFLCCDNQDAYKELQALGKFKLDFTDKTVFDRSVDQIRSAVVDLVLLSKTKYMLGSQWSSFTEVAHRLSGTPLRVAGVDF